MPQLTYHLNLYVDCQYWRKSLILYWWNAQNFWDEVLSVNPVWGVEGGIVNVRIKMNTCYLQLNYIAVRRQSICFYWTGECLYFWIYLLYLITFLPKPVQRVLCSWHICAPNFCHLYFRISYLWSFLVTSHHQWLEIFKKHVSVLAEIQLCRICLPLELGIWI